ncbi:MAG: hypothetical protein ACR2OW_03630 [Methyloligellaceae bacterium]
MRDGDRKKCALADPVTGDFADIKDIRTHCINHIIYRDLHVEGERRAPEPEAGH